MKTLLALLLLVPSLSWSEEIKLICNYTKEVYMTEGELQDSIFLDTEKKYIFIFDSNNKSLVKYYDYGNKEYYLDNQNSDEVIYHYTYEDTSMNVSHSEILELNRFTLEIKGGTFKDTSTKTMYSMECKITNQLL
tara:strand:+ start:60 stop:464 length:405 start_codon:yes stop_codon:yes gene_type:complete